MRAFAVICVAAGIVGFLWCAFDAGADSVVCPAQAQSHVTLEKWIEGCEQTGGTAFVWLDADELRVMTFCRGGF